MTRLNYNLTSYNEETYETWKTKCGPNSQDAAKQWKHWARTFNNCLKSLEQERRDGDPAINKLRILTKSVAGVLT